MIPLSLADAGQEQTIKKIGGNQETRLHLQNLGFNVGGTITVINTLNGNVLVKVKESRIALNDELARKIMV